MTWVDEFIYAMRESNLLDEEEDLGLRVRCLEASEGKKSARSTAIQDLTHLQTISAHTPKSLTQNRKIRTRPGRQEFRGRCHSRHDLQAQLPLRTRVCNQWGGIQSSRQDYDGCYGQGGDFNDIGHGPASAYWWPRCLEKEGRIRQGLAAHVVFSNSREIPGDTRKAKTASQPLSNSPQRAC